MHVLFFGGVGVICILGGITSHIKKKMMMIHDHTCDVSSTSFNKKNHHPCIRIIKTIYISTTTHTLTNGKLVKAQHVHHTHVAQHTCIQVRALVGTCCNKEATIGATLIVVLVREWV